LERGIGFVLVLLVVVVVVVLLVVVVVLVVVLLVVCCCCIGCCCVAYLANTEQTILVRYQHLYIWRGELFVLVSLCGFLCLSFLILLFLHHIL